MSALVVSNLHAGYGGHDVVHGIDIEIGEREVVVVIGPNGAGKSTALKAIAGLVSISRGSVKLNDRDITGWSPAEIAAAGAAFVPQEHNVFRSLSVAENLAIGGWLRPEMLHERTTEVLELFPELRRKLKTAAGLLSGGERQMVAVAMALMVNPKVLLLDEPTAGLSPLLVGQMLALLRRLTVQAGIAALVVEQNAQAALGVADRGYVLVDGSVARTGAASALLADPTTGALFLGEAA